MEYVNVKNRGQVSWIWAVSSSLLALVIIAGFVVLIQNTQSQLHYQALQNTHLNIGRLATYESLLYFFPAILLASWGLYIWVTASAARAGVE